MRPETGRAHCRPIPGTLDDHDEAVNSGKLIEFLEALIKDAGKKIVLIPDNLRVHHSKPVKVGLADRTNPIEVFYLPSCGPAFNPEERLNADLKQAMGKRAPVITNAQLRDAANEHMSHDWRSHPSG